MDVKEAIEKTGFPIIPDEKSGALQWYDVRELRLRYILSVEGIKKFYEGLKEGKLLATKCKCGRLFFPPQKDCPSCKKSEMEWVELKKEGVLETLTVIHVRPTSFSHYDPYVVGIAKLDDGVRILAWYRGEPKLKQGQRVRVEIVKRKEGYLTYELVPI